MTFFAEELCPELVSITKISGSRDIFAIAYLMISNNATNIFEALYKHNLPVMSRNVEMIYLRKLTNEVLSYVLHGSWL